MDKLEPIRKVFRDRGLFPQAANDALCADLLAAAALAPELGRVPDGWVVVPREPTPAMHRAYNRAVSTMSEHWAAAIAAAPEVPNE